MVDLRAWLAEGISTYALVFFGPLAVILSAAAFADTLSLEGILMDYVYVKKAEAEF